MKLHSAAAVAVALLAGLVSNMMMSLLLARTAYMNRIRLTAS
jgi:hypothetical protein